MTDTKNDLPTCVAKALANHDQTPFGVMTTHNPAGGDPKDIDTRPSYYREARRWLAVLKAVEEWRGAQ